MKIKNTKNFFSGSVFVILGGFFLFNSLSYEIGIASQMGPGYFPLAISTFLLLLGITIVIKSFTNND